MRNRKHKGYNTDLFRLMGVMSRTGIGASKYSAGGATLPQFQLCERHPMAYNFWGDSSQTTILLIGTNADRIRVRGVEVDEIAAFLDDLTESSVSCQPWLTVPLKIPLVKKSHALLIVLSVVTRWLVVGLLMTIVVVFTILFWILYVVLICFHFGSDPSFKMWSIDDQLSQNVLRSYTSEVRFQTLNLSAIDDSHHLSPPGSSDWIEKPHLIELLDKIKRYQYFALHSSAPSQQRPGSRMGRDERITSFYRTLIGNRSFQGSHPPEEWSTMFNVLINGPFFVPNEFLPQSHNQNNNTPCSNDSNAASDTSSMTAAQATNNERAQEYVQPLIESMLHSLYKRKVFISKEGHLGLADEEAGKGDLICAFLGCSFLVALRNNKFDRWDWKGKRKISRIGREERGPQIRERNRRFCTVMHGGAYLDGFMEGQAIQYLDNGVRELVEFELY